jgi:dTMP kinase
MFFSFDGIDGVGKSTQVNLLADRLRDRGFEVVVCRDPGTTSLGEQIRTVLLASDADTLICRRSELFLYMAARAQLVEEVIQPALRAGKVVIADRFLLANVVYQGHAGGLDPRVIWKIGEIATHGLAPNCVFLLDMVPASAGRRIDRPLDRMESQGDEYRDRLRAGFLAEARACRGIYIVAADQPIEVVQQEIWQIVAKEMGLLD